MITRSLLLLTLASLISCSQQATDLPQTDLAAFFQNVPHIEGPKAYLHSPYVTAGDRVYVVGHQDGQFPDLGWHVKGEMGGIWDHPIKLMDGFSITLEEDEQAICLDSADTFVNYPFANEMQYASALPELDVSRLQFVPDGEEAAVVALTLHNQADSDRELLLTFTGMSDLRPVWLGDRNGMENGPDLAHYDSLHHTILMQDSLSPWFVIWGSSLAAQSHQVGQGRCTFRRRGNGAIASLTYKVDVPAGERITIPFIIAGSYQAREQAQATWAGVQESWPDMLADKRARYEELAARAAIDIPDSSIQQAYDWVKYNVDWLIRDVPEQGRGLSAGLPDYPWWFGCDNSYSLPGVLATGRRDIVLSTIELIHELSDKSNGNGRIMHEASTNGVVFNPGNINETPHFVSLIWDVYTWTGDRDWLADYYPSIKEGLTWLMEEGDVDGNLLPDGFGMMEIHGMNSEMIDVAVYSQQAFADAAQIADALDDPYQAAQYQGVADRLESLIKESFWVEEFQSYADFIGTAEQARHLIEDAIVRADTLDKPWAKQELQQTRQQLASLPDEARQGFVLHHNWVVNTPMETGLADSTRAIQALNTARKFVNPFGAFVTGIDRDELAEQEDGSFAQGKKVFSYTGAVMTLPTGVLAIGENRYGRPDSALSYLKRLVHSFSYALPGSMYEVSPDFGMMTQAWNVYALATPLIQQFFGIQPVAYEQRIVIRPQMPQAWPEAKLRKLPVGNNELDMSFTKTEEGLEISLRQSRRNWTMELAFPADAYQTWVVNGKQVQPERREREVFVPISGASALVELR